MAFVDDGSPRRISTGYSYQFVHYFAPLIVGKKGNDTSVLGWGHIEGLNKIPRKKVVQQIWLYSDLGNGFILFILVSLKKYLLRNLIVYVPDDYNVLKKAISTISMRSNESLNHSFLAIL